MLDLITPFYRRKRFLQRPRHSSAGDLMRRHQLVELLSLSGLIILVWLGAHLDNQRVQKPAQQPMGIESASADLTVGIPVGKHRPL